MKGFVLMICCGALLSGCAARSQVYRVGHMQQSHVEPVCFLKSPLPSNLRFEIVGQIKADKLSYGTVSSLLPEMARSAREVGADAVINLTTNYRVGALAWARPVGQGTAVKIENKADLNCLALGGELR